MNANAEYQNGQTSAPSVLVVTTVARTLEAFLLPFAEDLRRAGWKVHAMAKGVSDSKACRQAFDGTVDVCWSRRPWDALGLSAAFSKVRDVVLGGNYRVVHFHTPIAAFIGRVAIASLPKAKRPLVIYTAHGFHFHPRGRRWMNRMFLLAERLASVSTDVLVTINVEDYLAAKRYRLAARVERVPGIGVDTRHYSPSEVDEADAEAMVRRLGVPRNAAVFSLVGEFTRNKRQADVVRAVRELGLPNVHVVFVGAGPLLSRTKRLAEKLGVSAQVHFAGQVADVRPIICASRATLVVSSREGLPRAALESLSLGVPIVGTRIRGVQELTDRGIGLSVEVGRPKEIAAALRSVIDDPRTAKEMGALGRRVVMKEYDLEIVRQRYLALIGSVTGVDVRLQ